MAEVTEKRLDLSGTFSKTIVPIIAHEKFTFPGGDPHIKLNTNDLGGVEFVHIIQRVNDMNDMVDILLAVDAIKQFNSRIQMTLTLPCLPAARQDRVCVAGEPLTCKVMANLINSCGFVQVRALTPHSDVMPALINNFKAADRDSSHVFDWIRDVTCNPEVKEVNIVSPDGGALKRVSNICKDLVTYCSLNSKKRIHKLKINMIRGDKSRDVATGKLTGFEAHADNLGGHPTIIVDDINCKGGTFRGLAAVLRAKRCGSLALYTTHSDCVEGIENVCKDFDHVYTTNSKKDWGDMVDLENFTCIELTL